MTRPNLPRPATDKHKIVEACCKDCGLVWTGATAKKDGKRHAEEEGHKVRVTIHMNEEHDGTKETK
jgi:hypothetical protein